MLVRIKKPKDLYYEGELIELTDEVAQHLIKEDLAEPANCPQCGSYLRDAGCAVYCYDCGYRKWKE